MTEDVSASSDEQVENTDDTNDATDVTDADVTDAQVEPANDSATEEDATTDEVKALMEQINTLTGKLTSIRDNADKNGAAVKTLGAENLRLKAAIEHGFSKDDLFLITAKDEAGIATQIAAIKARDERLAGSSSNRYVTLAGENGNTASTPSALEQKINAQLAQFK